MNLVVGDVVKWRGCFGASDFQDAKVESIEITGGCKSGEKVNRVNWDEVYERNVVVDLDNGHWAYAFQIKPN